MLMYDGGKLATMQTDNNKTQRALVLQGGGALGAYEAGAIRTLYEILTAYDKKKDNGDKLLFDIIAGTSIGAMNGAVLVSELLKTRNWGDAIGRLEKFWTEGLASSPFQNIKALPSWNPWEEGWYKNVPGAASDKVAERYYSVKNFLLLGAQKIYSEPTITPDHKFFDQDNTWFVYNNDRLRKTMEEFLSEPIATSFDEKQPRLLVFSVDVAEGKTITFDSYRKSGVSESEYPKDERMANPNHVVSYPGITIDHVMASGSLPLFYNYSKVPIKYSPKNSSTKYTASSNNEENIRYFWDGGLLSNTPLRELLQAHQEYWEQERNINKIPDLDVFIVNVHPSKMNIGDIPFDYDGIKDRYNDMLFGDRSSHYDEEMTNLVADYSNIAIEMKKFVDDTIHNMIDETVKVDVVKKFQDILTTKAISRNHDKDGMNYQDLIERGRYKLSNVVRIERAADYSNSISGKIGDFTSDSIRKLIEEGKSDARSAIEKQYLS
jgi:NTE family protein